MQKISVEGNVGGNLSEKKMKGEDGLKTLECLRGRLLAERVVSRNAKQDTDHLENKLIELEAQLTEEIKSRNRAERKLKFLMKKLNSLNISSASKDDKRDDMPAEESLSFVSDACFCEFITSKSHSEESIEKENSSMASNNFEQNVLQTTTSSQGSEYPATEEATSNSSGEACCEKSSELEANGYPENANTDDHSLKASKEEGETNGDSCDEGDDEYVDNSMALVPLDTPKTERTIDPVVLDATVKEVLDSLQSVKEELQISMEQRRMVKVG